MQTIHILLIDDNSQKRLDLRKALHQTFDCLEITECRRAEEVFQALSRTGQSIDAIVMDGDLPAAGGLDIYRKLKADAGRNLPPLVMLTRSGTTPLAFTFQRLRHLILARKNDGKPSLGSGACQREMARHLISAQENDRKLIAQEIHDSIGGNLATIKYALEEKLERLAGLEQSEEVPLKRIIDLVQQTIHESRRLSSKLRPAALYDQGLKSALTGYLDEFEQFHPAIRIRRGIYIKSGEVPEFAKVVVYRVLQEALTNVAKHSGADHVEITLDRSEDLLKLKIVDNGIGFDASAIQGAKDGLSGFGLAGMQDRARLSGGSLLVASQPDNGTSVCLLLPLRRGSSGCG